MKKISNLILVLAGATVLFTSCKKENPTPNDPSNPSGPNMSSFFQAKLNNAKQVFTINSEIIATVIGSQGTKLTFYPNSFVTQNGSPVTGTVTIEMIEIYGKKDMILMNKQTLGVTGDPANPLAFLISGGEFNIVAKQNGQLLNLAPGMGYELTAPAPNGTTNAMALFYGDVDEDDQLTWTQADSTFVEAIQNQYYTYVDHLNWVNLDYFMNSTSPLTTVKIQLPAGYSNQNSAVFISIDGYNSVASLYNFISGLFTSEPYYQIPVGMNVHFIVLSQSNNELRAAVIPAVIVDNHVEVVPALNVVTESQLEALLDNLP